MSLIDNKVVEPIEGGLITVRRDNVLLDVPVEQKSYYMGLGYNVVNDKGETLEETIPTDIGSLQRFYKDAKQQIAGLEAEIESLKGEIKSLKSQKKIKAPEPEEASFEEPVPTSTRRKKRQ